MTFDSRGFPINVHRPDPDKMQSQNLAPRYRVSRRKQVDNSDVNGDALLALKKIALKRMNAQSGETSPRNNKNTAEHKLLKIFDKLKKNPRMKLTEFLQVDERTGNFMGSRDVPNSKINEHIDVKKGVEMKNESGMLMKSGGKFNNDKQRMDMKTYLAQRKRESDKPMGMTGFGPIN